MQKGHTATQPTAVKFLLRPKLRTLSSPKDQPTRSRWFPGQSRHITASDDPLSNHWARGRAVRVRSLPARLRSGSLRSSPDSSTPWAGQACFQALLVTHLVCGGRVSDRTYCFTAWLRLTMLELGAWKTEMATGEPCDERCPYPACEPEAAPSLRLRQLPHKHASLSSPPKPREPQALKP